MSFQIQVEDLVGTVSDTVGLSQWLTDGVLDVTSKCMVMNPSQMESFMTVSGEQNSNPAALSIDGDSVISVVREDGVNNKWRRCRKILPNQEYDALDSSSIYFATSYSPVFMISDNGDVSVFPAPGADPNTFKVFYINDTPVDTAGSAIDNASTTIKYFPKDKVHLVILYASIQALQRKMADDVLTITAVPPDDLVITATEPTAISLTTVNYNPVSTTSATALVSLTAPTYTKPSQTAQVAFSGYTSGLVETDPGLLAISSPSPAPPELSVVSYTSGSVSDVVVTPITFPSSDVPTYTSPTVTGGAGLTGMESGVLEDSTDQIEFDTWWNIAADYIETEEDTELAETQLRKISTYINAYQAETQDALNEFNEENAEFQLKFRAASQDAQSTNQAALQDMQKDLKIAESEAIQTTQAIIADNSAKMQEFQASISEYQASVSAEVQEYSQNLSKYQLELTTSYQTWSKTESDNLQAFQIDIQNELNEFNKEQASFQYESQKALADAQATNQVALQNEVQEAQDAIQNNTANMSRFQAMSQHYATQVNEDVQAYTSRLGEYQAEVSAEVQEAQMRTQQYQAQYVQLKQQYDSGFIGGAPSGNNV